MGEEEFEKLRQQLEALGPRAKRRRYPKRLREKIIEWVKERRSDGARWKLISEEVGISSQGLWRLVKEEKRKSGIGEMRAIKIIKEPRGGDKIVLHARQFSVEGLDVPEFAELLGRLG